MFLGGDEFYFQRLVWKFLLKIFSTTMILFSKHIYYFWNSSNALFSYQEFKGKLNARRVVIEQALEQGHNFLLKHQSSQDETFMQRGDKLVVRVASSLREQLTHIQSQWLDLQNNSDKWEKTISLVLEVRPSLFPFLACPMFVEMFWDMYRLIQCMLRNALSLFHSSSPCKRVYL